MTKYDDASWHSGGDFPVDLTPEAGATHIGMFLAWAWLRGLAGELHAIDFPDDVELARSRAVSPRQLATQCCDGKLTDEDFNELGNGFAKHYLDLESGVFFADYEAALGATLPSLYHVEDTWANFDRLRPVIDERFESWRAV